MKRSMSVTSFFDGTSAIPMNIGWGFWWRWVLLTLVGFLVSLLFVEIGVRPYVGLWQGAMGGAIVGLAQWFAIAEYVSRDRWWMVASIFCWGLIGASGLGAVGWIAPRSSVLPVRAIAGIVNGAAIGFCLGLGQWFVLQPIPKANWWIFLSTVAWAIGLSCGWVVGGILYAIAHLFLCEAIGLAVAWIVVAGITGLALVRLLRNAVRF